MFLFEYQKSKLYLINISSDPGVLNNGADEFESADDVYEALGEMLTEVSEEEKSNDYIW